ncbi:MAG TPA: magnesium transporter [Terriglobia bacterium]|nr:magnesium transporter [Terriglobia bacterium]
MQGSTTSQPPSRRVRVVLATTALLSFKSVSNATAFVFAELGIGIFFVSGIARSFIGDSAPWFVLAACGLSAIVRAIDIESWAFLMPGGLVARTERAFGQRVGRIATAVMLTERLLLVALATVLCGHYAVSFAAGWMAQWTVTSRLTLQETVMTGAIVLIGILWTRSRLRLPIPPRAVVRGIWIGSLVLVGLVIFGIVTVARQDGAGISAVLTPPWSETPGSSVIGKTLQLFVGIALVLPMLGGGGSLGRAAREFAPPRVQSVRRTAFSVFVLVAFVAIFSSFFFVALIPRDEAEPWAATPLSAIAQNVSLPAWMNGLLTVLVLGSAFFLLLPAARAALEDAEQLLNRLSVDGMLPGNMANSANIVAAATVLITIAGGAQVSWLSRAYGISVAAALLLRMGVNARLRRLLTETPSVRVPALGKGVVAGVVGLSALAMILLGDGPSLIGLGLISVMGLVLIATRGSTAPIALEEEPFELSTARDVSLVHVDVRPGNVLVAIRHPDSLTHVVTAIQAAGDRDVVAVTVRVLGVDVDDEPGNGTPSTRDERYLFSQVIALTERYARPVRLLIVPAQNIFDGVVGVALKLHSSEIYVAESDTLSANDQARLLGDAWERAEKPAETKLRLVICHKSGRTDAFHLGAHPPALMPSDLELIHRVWLDAVKAVGPHVHHHDVVRAALKKMEQQLTGPDRDATLEAIRQIARPADELESAVRAGDFTRLRDLLRNRHASDVADALTDLSIDQQVIVFRILPRKDAAAVFEYLSLEQQGSLLKAMAHEEVASLLNSMAPDDRTMFLEELPASVTRQLLAMLTPAERAVASKLLGYPEGSIGRLMTPHYVSVREHWTIREVLDHIRTHGQDSETLNVVYVIDEQGMLIDDIRSREFLLSPLDKRVGELMDRRFVALKANDDQQHAVALFRQYDRTALPVTDSAGGLIGIVTIDDVLDVAEAAATKEIQRIGGSEALEEPYIEIALSRMVRKRAGWLTALFLGETLTAVAMGYFEGEIERVVTLALFIPLIISSGGNSGSQAATLVIRALALGEITISDWWRIVRREIFAGLALGGILGAIGFLRVSVWGAFFETYGPHWMLMAITVAVALIGVVLWGSLVGSILPLGLQKLGFDPATSSAPFVATLVDVTGLIIYFSVALVVLRGTLL